MMCRTSPHIQVKFKVILLFASFDCKLYQLVSTVILSPICASAPVLNGREEESHAE